MAERISRSWWLLLGMVWLCAACVSTEELYADYDDRLCPVVVRSATGAEVTQRVVDRLSGEVFTFAPEIFFEHDSYMLSAESRDELDLVLVILERYPSLNIELSGFTSRRGSNVYNKRLSERRVAVVSAYISGAGVDVSRIVKQGVGPDVRNFLSDPAANEVVNRRVALTLLDAAGREVRQQYPDPASTVATPVATQPESTNVRSAKPELGAAHAGVRDVAATPAPASTTAPAVSSERPPATRPGRDVR